VSTLLILLISYFSITVFSLLSLRMFS
jgi:hypothetical protein